MHHLAAAAAAVQVQPVAAPAAAAAVAAAALVRALVPALLPALLRVLCLHPVLCLLPPRTRGWLPQCPLAGHPRLPCRLPLPLLLQLLLLPPRLLLAALAPLLAAATAWLQTAG